MHNFILNNADTDSIMISKPDGLPWSKEEQDKFLEVLNEQYPEKIRFEHDGIFSKVLVIKSKNYILQPEGSTKLKIKGSALKDAKKPPILKEFMNEVVQSLLDEKGIDDVISIYNKYCLMCFNIKDIKPWCKKATITEKITRCAGHSSLTPEEKKTKGIRTNESKVYDAIAHKVVQEGDKIYLYFKKDKTLALAEDFNGEYDEFKLVASIYSTLNTFINLFDIERFTKYNLKKNQKILLGMLNDGNTISREVSRSD